MPGSLRPSFHPAGCRQPARGICHPGGDRAPRGGNRQQGKTCKWDNREGEKSSRGRRVRVTVWVLGPGRGFEGGYGIAVGHPAAGSRHGSRPGAVGLAPFLRGLWICLNHRSALDLVRFSFGTWLQSVRSLNCKVRS